MICGHRDALDPLLDHHLRRAGHDVRDDEVRMVLIGLGERALVVGLQPVVEFHLGALDQLVDDALHVGAGGELLEHADHPLHGLQVGAQRLVGARVLDLDRDLAAVGPHRLVHLADAGRGHRRVVERREPLPPLGAQLRVEHAVHLGRGQRRGVLAAAWSAPRGRARRTARGSRPPCTDSAWPTFIAPPLSSPRTVNNWWAALSISSALTSSFDLPVSRLPKPSAARPAMPTGKARQLRVTRGTARV